MNLENKSGDVWKALAEVKDPEIPVLSLVDLGVIREAKMDGECVVVTMTPTFAGCPAMEQMKRDVLDVLRSKGFPNARVETVLSSSWSTDSIGVAAKEKLRAFGIAPPPKKLESLEATLTQPVACPFCHSTETKLESSFGATLCKQIYYCSHCSQSFERFKPL